MTNFVTLAPRKVLMPAGNPVTEEFYGDLGIDVVTVKIDELVKAAGAIRTLKGVKEMLLAGADRIGSSSGIIIIKELMAAKE